MKFDKIINDRDFLRHLKNDIKIPKSTLHDWRHKTQSEYKYVIIERLQKLHEIEKKS